MSKKTCESFFCTKRVPAKYRYCYDCAKSKGHIGSDRSVGWWLVVIIIVIVLFG
tara:strand:+ start:1590 stop:1751 length:162 start_codon:yes stop_codon:yes gene_type:complete